MKYMKYEVCEIKKLHPKRSAAEKRDCLCFGYSMVQLFLLPSGLFAEHGIEDEVHLSVALVVMRGFT